MVFRKSTAAVLALLLWAASAYGQASLGALLGTVIDSSGAVIPGVTITVTNEQTNQSRSALTNETGNYRVEPLQPGTYSIEAELPGFRKEIRSKITISVDARVRQDFVLQLGDVSQTLEVTAAAPTLQTDESQIAQVMDQRKIISLPLNGRNFSQLAYLTPGAFAPRPGSQIGYRGGFVSAGLAEKTNQFLVDGINNTSGFVMEVVHRVNIDTVAEFKVQTQNYAAQYGRFAGAHVDAVIKSGSNEWHGGVFGFTRNNKWDARNFFDPYPLPEKPPFKRHQYGGTLGGPIIHNKAFFFFGFQGQRQVQFRSTQPTVPFPEYWEGNLSRIPKVIRDPLTGQPFPNNQIPKSRIDPTALAFRPFFFVEASRDTLARNANASIREPDNFWQPDIKINWSLSPQHELTGSWGLFNNDLEEWEFAGRPELPNYNVLAKLKNQRFAISEVWTISPKVINEFRAGIARSYRFRVDFLHEKNYARDVLGIAGTLADTDPIGNAVPALTINGYSKVGRANAQPRKEGTYSITDMMSIQKGNHSIKFGGDLMQHYVNCECTGNISSFSFNGAATGDAFADFLLGLPDVTMNNVSNIPIAWNPRRWSSNWFFQDDWKTTRTLTINYGMRWELSFPLDDRWGRVATFDASLGGGQGGIRLVETGKDGGKRYDAAVAKFKEYYPNVEVKRYGKRLNPIPWKQFAPRFGFAWTPSGGSNFVVRGGYGIFYNLNALAGSGGYNSGPPFQLTQRFTRIDGPTFRNPWPGAGLGTLSRGGNDPNFRNAYVQSWDLSVQRDLHGFLVEAAYVAKKGTTLDRSRDLNQPINGVRPYPRFGPIDWYESSGSSTYHGLQTRFERRAARSLNILASYAWSKLIDDNSGAPIRDSYNLRIERGLGEEDMRHRFAASYVYELPWGRGRSFLTDLNGIGEAFLGGWELSGILRLNSGSPVTPRLSFDNSGLGRREDRPDIIGNPKLDNPNPRTGWFNKAAFQTPQRGSTGNAGRGSLIGPGFAGTDLSVLKHFSVGERRDLQLRVEIFNLLNQVNFWPIDTLNFDSPTFGTIGTALPGRQFQLGMKYTF